VSAMRDFNDYVRNVLGKSGGTPDGNRPEAVRLPASNAADAELKPARSAAMPSAGPTAGAKAAPAAGAAGAPATAAGPSPVGKTKTPPPKPGPLTATAVITLVDNLVYLADPYFLEHPHAPAQPKKVVGDPSVDSVLGQAADVVRLWSDPKTLPQAHQIWRNVQPRLSALLSEAEGPNLGIEPGVLKPARDAIAKISKYLGIREAYAKLKDTEAETETPDMTEASAARELTLLEPTLMKWREILGKGGQLTGTSQLKTLARGIGFYFSAPDMPSRLTAFRNAGLVDKNTGTLTDVAVFLSRACVTAAQSVTEEAIHAAQKLGKEAAASALQKFLGTIPHVAVHKAAAMFGLALGIYKLVVGIAKGDWDDIAVGAFETTEASLELAELLELLPEGSAHAILAGGVAVWGTVDAILTAAALHRWAKEYRALQAFKSMVKDAKKVVPLGKQMAAATQLMLQTNQASTDGEEAAQYDIYKQQALKYAVPVSQALKALAGNAQGTSLDSVYGYPALVNALGGPARQMLDKARMGIDPNDPMTLTDAFKTIALGIKAMVTEGDKLYGEAGPGLE
jgi:hypothetical protein